MKSTAKRDVLAARVLLNKALDHASRAADALDDPSQFVESLKAENLFAGIQALIAEADTLLKKL